MSVNLKEKDSIICSKQLTKYLSLEIVMEMEGMTKIADGFVKDKNGKIHIVPWPSRSQEYRTTTEATESSDRKGNILKRKYIPIKPMNLDAFNFNGSPKHTAKKSKLDTNIRKELFKVPQKKVNKRLTYGKRTPVVTKGLSPLRKSSVIKKPAQNGASPLLDIDETEEFLNHNKLTAKSVKIVLFADNSNQEKQSRDVGNTPPKNLAVHQEKTPTSADSLKEEAEFLELERKLSSAKKENKKNITDSPMTSVCALLEKAKITKSVKKQANNTILSQVANLIKEDMEQFANFQKQHEKKMGTILELLEQLSEDKENTNRRSLRIASQNVLSKINVSPTVPGKVDLRKSTLNKNLTKNLQNESPRMKNAMQMYDSLRNEYSVLCTPKLERPNLDSSQNSITRSLSRRIQEQCLRLQDTPRH